MIGKLPTMVQHQSGPPTTTENTEGIACPVNQGLRCILELGQGGDCGLEVSEAKSHGNESPWRFPSTTRMRKYPVHNVDNMEDQCCQLVRKMTLILSNSTGLNCLGYTYQIAYPEIVKLKSGSCINCSK